MFFFFLVLKNPELKANSSCLRQFCAADGNLTIGKIEAMKYYLSLFKVCNQKTPPCHCLFRGLTRSQTLGVTSGINCLTAVKSQSLPLWSDPLFFVLQHGGAVVSTGASQVSGSNPRCGLSVWMFSSCLCGFSPNALASSVHRHAINRLIGGLVHGVPDLWPNVSWDRLQPLWPW